MIAIRVMIGWYCMYCIQFGTLGAAVGMVVFGTAKTFSQGRKLNDGLAMSACNQCGLTS
jgi:hypothetical protein